jgi:hypothetical protein
MSKATPKGSISFNVSGYFVQDIEIIVNDLTLEELTAGLNRGEYWTTIHSDNPFIERVQDGAKVARILNTDDNVGYGDYIYSVSLTILEGAGILASGVSNAPTSQVHTASRNPPAPRRSSLV